MKAAIPELSADTRALAAALRAVEAGQIVTYEALTAVIGREVLIRAGLLPAAPRGADAGA